MLLHYYQIFERLDGHRLILPNTVSETHKKKKKKRQYNIVEKTGPLPIKIKYTNHLIKYVSIFCILLYFVSIDKLYQFILM